VVLILITAYELFTGRLEITTMDLAIFLGPWRRPKFSAPELVPESERLRYRDTQLLPANAAYDTKFTFKTIEIVCSNGVSGNNWSQQSSAEVNN